MLFSKDVLLLAHSLALFIAFSWLISHSSHDSQRQALGSDDAKYGSHLLYLGSCAEGREAPEQSRTLAQVRISRREIWSLRATHSFRQIPNDIVCLYFVFLEQRTFCSI